MSNLKNKNNIPLIFDRKNIISRDFNKSKFYKNISIEISERLKEINIDIIDAIEINSKINDTELIIKNTQKINNLYKTNTNEKYHVENISAVCDEELIPFKNNCFDMVFSILGLNLINDLPGALKQIHNILKPNGFFIAAFWGQGTLAPLAESLAYADEKLLNGLYPRIYPFCDIKTLGNLMQRAGFSDSVADLEKIVCQYKNISDLFSDIRDLSEKNILTSRKKSFTPNSIFIEAEKYLLTKYAQNSRILIPYNIIYVSGWKK